MQKLVGLVTNSKYQIFHTCLKINFSWVFSKFYVIWPHNSLLHVEILRIFDLWFSSCAIWRFTWDDDHQRDLAETSLRENETDHLSRIQCKACWCSVNQKHWFQYSFGESVIFPSFWFDTESWIFGKGIWTLRSWKTYEPYHLRTFFEPHFNHSLIEPNLNLLKNKQHCFVRKSLKIYHCGALTTTSIGYHDMNSCHYSQHV